MSNQRLDKELVERQLVSTRSRAAKYIALGYVKVNGRVETRPEYYISKDAVVEVTNNEQYVSRAALKLKSVSDKLHIDFGNKNVLDIGSSTGGFTDFALRNGARRIIAVDIGTDQMDQSLLNHPQIELHEQTDIRNMDELSDKPDIVLIDVSFISLRDILPHVYKLIDNRTMIVAMVKPQFEAVRSSLKNKGVIKNDRIRRDVLRSFEEWAQSLFIIVNKADSDVSGVKGNVERFYVLRKP